MKRFIVASSIVLICASCSDALMAVPMQSAPAELEVGVPYAHVFNAHCGVEYLPGLDGRSWKTNDPLSLWSDEVRPSFADPTEAVSPLLRGEIKLVSQNALEWRLVNTDIVLHYEPTDDEVPPCA